MSIGYKKISEMIIEEVGKIEKIDFISANPYTFNDIITNNEIYLTEIIY